MPHDFTRQMPDAEHHLSRRPGLMFRLHLDIWLLGILLVLMAGGLFVLYSASGADMHETLSQVYRLLFAMGVMVMLAQVHPRHYRRLAPFAYGVTVLMLVGVLLEGVHAKGAQRWLVIPGVFRFQPSEIMKLAMPLTLAAWLSGRPLPPRWKELLSCAVILAVPILLIAKQPDLGTSLLVGAAGIFVVLLAGLSWRLVGFFSVLAMAGLPALWMVMHEYQRNRVLTFLNPERDPLGAGWNIIQSKTAIGSGGIYGKGWLHGTQSQLEFLPERHTDFIIAVLGEEFGLIGMSILMVIYLLLIWRGMQIAIQAQDTFSRLLAGAISLTFFVYVFVNIGMVSGILPVVGVPLPLVSYGGTSSVTLLAGFGILMSIHTHRDLIKRA